MTIPADWEGHHEVRFLLSVGRFGVSGGRIEMEKWVDPVGHTTKPEGREGRLCTTKTRKYRYYGGEILYRVIVHTAILLRLRLIMPVDACATVSTNVEIIACMHVHYVFSHPHARFERWQYSLILASQVAPFPQTRSCEVRPPPFPPLSVRFQVPAERLDREGETPFEGEKDSHNNGDDPAIEALPDDAVDDDSDDEVLSVILHASSPHTLSLSRRSVHSRRPSPLEGSAVIQLSVEGSRNSTAMSDPGRAETMTALLDLGTNEPTAIQSVLTTNSAIPTTRVVKSALADSTARCPSPLPGMESPLVGVLSPRRSVPPGNVTPRRSVPYPRDVESLSDELLDMAPLGAPLRLPPLPLTSPQSLAEQKNQRRLSPLTTPVRCRARSLSSREIQNSPHVDNSNSSPMHSSTSTAPFLRRVLLLPEMQARNLSPTYWRHRGHRRNRLTAWREGSSGGAMEGSCSAAATAATGQIFDTLGDQAKTTAAASSTCNQPQHVSPYSTASPVSSLSSHDKVVPSCSQGRDLLPQQGETQGYGLDSRGGSTRSHGRRTDTGRQEEEKWVRLISVDSAAIPASTLLGDSQCLVQGADRAWSGESDSTVVAKAAAVHSLNERAIDNEGPPVHHRANFTGCSSYGGDGSDLYVVNCVDGGHTTPAAPARHPSSTSNSHCSNMAPAATTVMSTQPSMPSSSSDTSGTSGSYSSGRGGDGHGAGGSGIAPHTQVISVDRGTRCYNRVGRQEDESRSVSDGSGDKEASSCRSSSTGNGAVLLPVSPSLQPRSRMRAHGRGRRSTSAAKPERRYRSASPCPADGGDVGGFELYCRSSLSGGGEGGGEREHQRGTVQSESQSLHD